jgi:hypothetical protein
MTPTRALVGIAAVAAAGYVAIHSMGDKGPQYIGDFPSIQEQSQAEPGAVSHDAGAPQPGDPTHYGAQPVTPEAAPGAPAAPAGPGPVPPAAAPGGGGTGGEGGSPPAFSPPSGGLTPLTDLLGGLVGALPTLDAQGFCRLTTGQVVALPCDQIPALPTTIPAAP